jgi:acetyltransferase-like isoleucine patch superfamily enzyme
LRRDHRPYCVKKAHLKFQILYARHFIKPQFDYLGKGFTFLNPWNIEVFGSPIKIGKHANIITTSDHKVRFTVWAKEKDKGKIQIGDYCLICPGVRISSAEEIIISDNCMIASSVYITDTDWHDIYNRVHSLGNPSAVHIGENAWIGDSAIICKGVRIGENSIVGAGSVVISSIPPNTIAAGNPARVVKQLDPEKLFVKRSEWFADPAMLAKEIDEIDRDKLKRNTLRHWLRTFLFPSIKD